MSEDERITFERVYFNSPWGAFKRVGPLTFAELQDFRRHEEILTRVLSHCFVKIR